MTTNLSFDTLFSYVGPWWFFSLIIQLYILFPTLFWLIRKYKEKGFLGLLILSYAAIYILSPIAIEHNIPLFANFTGHLPEFILGIGVALFPNIRLDIKIFIFACLLFIGSCFSEILFPFSFITITIIMLYIYLSIANRWTLDGLVSKSIVFVGKMSMFIFILNPLIRMKTLSWIQPYIYNEQELYITGFAILHTVIAIIVSYLGTVNK